jgi:tRNA (uracil-5-)-methyltransferase
MYCGNGNHTCVMARHFSRVLAVEINGDLVQTARHNLAANGLNNAMVVQVCDFKPFAYFTVGTWVF